MLSEEVPLADAGDETGLLDTAALPPVAHTSASLRQVLLDAGFGPCVVERAQPDVPLSMETLSGVLETVIQDPHDVHTLAMQLLTKRPIESVQVADIASGAVEIGKLGEGGFAIVTIVWDGVKNVVCKRLRSNKIAHYKERFDREIDLLRVLDGSCAPQLLIASDTFFVMDHTPGMSLHDILFRDAESLHLRGPVPQEVVERIGLAVACALREAHQRGIIHRDIKPANLLISDFGDVKILDWGLGKRLAQAEEPSGSTSATEEFTVLGSWPFMSPEQAVNAKHATQLSDVYSLGATLYLLLTGMPLHKGNNRLQILGNITSAEPHDLSAISDPSPRSLLGRMVAKNSERRCTVDDVIAFFQGRTIDSSLPSECRGYYGPWQSVLFASALPEMDPERLPPPRLPFSKLGSGVDAYDQLVTIPTYLQPAPTASLFADTEEFRRPQVPINQPVFFSDALSEEQAADLSSSAGAVSEQLPSLPDSPIYTSRIRRVRWGTGIALAAVLASVVALKWPRDGDDRTTPSSGEDGLAKAVAPKEPGASEDADVSSSDSPIAGEGTTTDSLPIIAPIAEPVTQEVVSTLPVQEPISSPTVPETVPPPQKPSLTLRMDAEGNFVLQTGKDSELILSMKHALPFAYTGDPRATAMQQGSVHFLSPDDVRTLISYPEELALPTPMAKGILSVRFSSGGTTLFLIPGVGTFVFSNEGSCSVYTPNAYVLQKLPGAFPESTLPQDPAFIAFANENRAPSVKVPPEYSPQCAPEIAQIAPAKWPRTISGQLVVLTSRVQGQASRP